jgi:hypothetical protein
MIVSSLLLFFSIANPFELKIDTLVSQTKEGLQTIEDAIEEQQLIHKIDALFSLEQQKFNLSDVEIDAIQKRLRPRITRGIFQTFSSAEQKVGLVKINHGGSKCIVTCVDLSKKRSTSLIPAIQQALESVGFDGYLYYRLGGIPNPRDGSYKFCTVPYSFKIFLMEEAKNLGFSNVLWIDSRLIPIRSLDEVFDIFQKNNGFFIDDQRMIRANFLSFSIEAFKKNHQIHPLEHTRIVTPVFGLNFKADYVERLVEDYYACCKSGLEFLSVFPEEHVISCLLAKQQKKGFRLISETNPKLRKHLWIYDSEAHDPNLIQNAMNSNFFFYGVSNSCQGDEELKRILYFIKKKHKKRQL